MYRFWNNYLIVFGFGILLTGLAFAFFQEFVLIRALTDAIAAQVIGGHPDAQAERLASLYLGIVGAVTVFMGSVILMLSLGPFKRPDSWAWWTLTVSLAGWYVIDTLVAFAAGATVLIAFNSTVIAMLALPLAAIHRPIRREGRKSLA